MSGTDGPSGAPRIELFGGVRVVRNGDPLAPGPIPATILSVLALAAPEPVGADRLIEATWGSDPPDSARGSLQAHVSRLRKALDPHRERSPSPIEAIGDGYRLTLTSEQVDVGRFRRATAAARSAAEWRAALDLLEGPPLPRCSDTWVVEAERGALEDERLAAAASWATAAIEEGHGQQAVAELQRLVAEHPLRERLWALLVRALGACGRQSDALETFHQARDVLIESAGVEPGPELQAAQRAVLDQDLPTVGRPAREVRRPSRRASLPTPRTPLVGREHETRQVADWLDSWRLVTIVGPGGAGKTRLATEVAGAVAGAFPGGVLFVDLTVAHDEGDVVSVLASAAGVRMVGERDRFVPAVAEQLGREATLFVIDNCEHVIEEVARVVDQLLDEADVCTVLATSRRPLGVGGERLAPLGSLPPDAATELFRERAHARSPGVELPDDVVLELVTRLDGLPLAIELAAARTDHLSVREILTRVAASLATLERLDPVADPRHHDLAAAIRWSYELLDEGLRSVLRRVAVFRQPFGRDQAAAVVGDEFGPEEIDAALGRLVAHSLVVAEPGDAESRFRLLETIRTFARSELAAEGEADAAARRHRDWYVRMARGFEPGTTLLDISRAYPLEAHHADLVAALEDAERSGDGDDLVDLAVLAAGLAFCPAGLPDAATWIMRASTIGANDRVAVGDLLGVSALVMMLRDDIETTIELGEQVVALPDDEPLGAAPVALALCMTIPEGAATAADRTDRLLRTRHDEIRPDVRFELAAMRQLPDLYTQLDPATALDATSLLWEGHAWSDRRTMATWTIHAGLLHVNGEHEELQARLRNMERVDPSVGPPTYFAGVFDALTAAVAGNVDGAVEHVRGIADQHWLGVPGVSSELLGTLAAIRTIMGDPDGARRLLETPGLRPRHPGTAIVHIFYRQLHGVDIGRYASGWWGRGRDPEVEAVLADELDRWSADR